MSGELVLVTGGSGFVGAHCVVRLLEAGHRVRATVRSPAREADVRAMVAAGRTEARAAAGGAADRTTPDRTTPNGTVLDGSDGTLTFAVADLGADEGWAEAVAGCAYVLHVASPFPAGEPAHEDDLVVPARDGALRVLRAARDAGVRRVVLTSSFGAIGYGHPPTDAPFTEETWTDVEGPGVGAYVKSKTLAERAAWEFAATQGGGTELAVVNPVGVFGPVLGPDYSASVGLVRQLLDGGMTAVPRTYFAVVDVRDVADLHLRAMTDPAAAGERFVAAAGDVTSLRDVAVLLKERLGAAGARVPTEEVSQGAGPADADPAGQAAARPVPIRRTSAAKAGRLLGWAPRPGEEAVLATAESLLRLDRR
ncbi:putative dihydrokaempferol 4-reductase [Actinacidiphila reveromycinica]|uniref:Putative dihydrokaempferol 4-reductase n=1 Tax=Actinacidiphila reveromycinica TaxID=659352 RepID=A0A7U3VMB5_9ACTN|nr:aldehyde reductase [Streptomyces sp. SN-593]BBA96455.1 putative dihydrokaempferol 4-reductase [Streptomyces sp. SN-593]